MNEWHALINDLETTAPELDELSRNRIDTAVQSALPKRRLRWKAALVAAVLVLLTACGVAVSRYSRWFWNLAQDPFAPEQSEDVLASMGTEINQSQTVDGVTVTLHGAIYDGEYLMLALSVEGDQIPETDSRSIQCGNSSLFYSKAQYEKNLQNSNYKEILDPMDWDAYYQDYLSWYDEMARWGNLQLHSRTNYRSGYRTFILQATLPWKNDDSTEPVELLLHLQDMEFDDYTAKGPFDFVFSVLPNHARREYEGQVDVEVQPGVHIQVDRIVVTPLRISVYFTGIGTFPADEEWNFKVENVYAGKQNVYSSSSGGTISYNEQDGSWRGSRCIGPLGRVVDPVEVTAIEIAGSVIDLSQMQLLEPSEHDLKSDLWGR